MSTTPFAIHMTSYDATNSEIDTNVLHSYNNGEMPWIEALNRNAAIQLNIGQPSYSFSERIYNASIVMTKVSCAIVAGFSFRDKCRAIANGRDFDIEMACVMFLAIFGSLTMASAGYHFCTRRIPTVEYQITNIRDIIRRPRDYLEINSDTNITIASDTFIQIIRHNMFTPSVSNADLAKAISETNRQMMLGFANIAIELGTMKVDIAGLKTDVSELKTDVSELKTDVSELKISTDYNSYLLQELTKGKGLLSREEFKLASNDL